MLKRANLDTRPMSSERLMYVQFKSCVQGLYRAANISSKVYEDPARAN